MVTSGKDASEQASIDEVAKRTLDCLLANVPTDLPGITFLSGGQSDRLAGSGVRRVGIECGGRCRSRCSP